MAFTAKDVQALRERTGCGMMDCKNALVEANGDMDKAIEVLREKGLAKQAKKAGRIAAEGIVGTLVDHDAKVACIIEVNSETDFVAKNETFKEFVANCAKSVLKYAPADVEALLACKYGDGDTTVADELRDKVLVIGENLQIRRFERIEGVVVDYIHGGGRIGVLVSFDVDDAAVNNDTFVSAAKDIAMQVAASVPAYLDKDSVPAEVLEEEKKVLTAQAINEGKPANIAEKMVAGRIGKYYKENCLVEQPYIKNGDMTVTKFLESVSKEIGMPIKVTGFIRYEKGEGLQKREDNFADEVASMVK